MKKIQIVLCLAFVLSLCACGRAKLKLPRSQTAAEQLDETGITLRTPYGAEQVNYWMVEGPSGKAIPEVRFTWNGAAYFYRAERSEAQEPYDFSGLEGPWSEEGTFGDDARDGIAAAGEAGVWLSWIEEGVAYLVCSYETHDLSDIFEVGHEIAAADAGLFSQEDTDEGDYTALEMTAAEQVTGTWRYDSSGALLRIGNYVYWMYDAEGAPVDELVRFWEEDGEDSIRLLHENETPYLTLTLSGEEWAEQVLTNSEGETLHRWDGAPDGTYDIYLSEAYLSGEELFLMEQNQFWLRPETVESLADGQSLAVEPGGYGDVVVRQVEQRSAQEYSLGPEVTVRYDETAQAWRLYNTGFQSYRMVGRAALDEDVRFTDRLDGGHTGFMDCLLENGDVNATAEVTHGKVTALRVTGLN